MSTIHFNQTTTLTPDQYVAGLTDFGPGRSKVFGNSADEYLKVHSKGTHDADVTEGSGVSGSDCITTGPIPTVSSSRRPTPTCGEARQAKFIPSHVSPTERPTLTLSLYARVRT
jgi:hypothetical protein